jgi:hypothetical protein
MNNILYTQFGSHIYGTNVPTSDMDFKAVFIPTAKDIVLQRAPGTIVQNTKTDKNARNTADDVDIEMFSLHRYLDLLMQGQTVALDMLFTPDSFHSKGSWQWDYIRQHKNEFLHKGTVAFIGYAKQQAGKYGIKGTRVAALRTTLDLFNKHEDYKKLNHVDVFFDLLVLCYSNFIDYNGDPLDTNLNLNNEFIKLINIKGPNNKIELHLEVCNRKIPLHATVKYAKSIFQKIFDEYGARALQAEKNEGVDWKALMHAVRVCGQAYELLSTGHITFPRPEAHILLQIRKGELQYKAVAECIEMGLEDLEKAKLKSSLRDEPNRLFASEFIEDVYSAAVLGEYGYEGN